jgi:hypothetical protein
MMLMLMPMFTSVWKINGEDEIGVALRDEAESALGAVEEPATGELPGANRHARLYDMVTGPQGVGLGVEENGEPFLLVILESCLGQDAAEHGGANTVDGQAIQVPHQGECREAAGEDAREVADPRTGEEGGPEPDGDNHECGPEVRLGKNQGHRNSRDEQRHEQDREMCGPVSTPAKIGGE